MTQAAGVDFVIGETVHHRKNGGISLETADCLGVIGKA